MELRANPQKTSFPKYHRAIKRHLLPATGVFCTVLGLSFLALRSPQAVYQAEGQILVEKHNQGSELTGLEHELGEVPKLSAQTNPMLTVAEILRSRPILEKAIEKLGLVDETGEPLDPNLIAAALEVKQIGRTDILRITYQGDDPQLAAQIVNQAIEVYIAQDLATNREQLVAARQFMEEQLPQLEATLSQAETELRSFKEKNSLTNVEAEAQKSLQNLQFLETKVVEVETQIAYAQTKLAEFESQLGMNAKQSIAAAAVSQSPGIQQALEEVQTLQLERTQQQSRFQAQHPQILRLREKEAALNEIVQERIEQTLGTRQLADSNHNLQMGELEQGIITDFVAVESASKGLANRINVFEQHQSTQQERLALLPQLSVKQKELQRKINAAQTTYETLLSKLQETRIAEQQQLGNVRIIETAIAPPNPLPQPTNLILWAGGIAALVAGVGTALCLDKLDNSLPTLQEVKAAFGYTLLGVVPNFDQSGQVGMVVDKSELNIPRVIARDMPHSPVMEAYHMLRANLKFLRADEPIKSIVVTSSVAGEGKSEVAANLAMAMAQVGHRVLLVDTDMRQPMQHHVWGINNVTGLSNVLIDEANLAEATQKVAPGLEVLPAGAVWSNPLALLDSRRMTKLMATVSGDYDAIIFDTPAVTQMPHVKVLGNMVDGVLLVARPGVVDARSADNVKELMQLSGQNVLGIVANGIEVAKEPDSYIYYQKQDNRKRDYALSESQLLKG